MNNYAFELSQYNAEDETGEKIQLLVRDQEGKEIEFRMNKAILPSKQKKVFSKVAIIETIRFFFDGPMICKEGNTKSSEWKDDMIKTFFPNNRL